MKILVADDYPATLDIYKRVLQRAGHEIVTARNGEKAWEAFRVAVQELTPFGLLMLDVSMPITNGLECAIKIRRFEKEQDMTPTRLIFLSAHLGQIPIADVARLGIHTVAQKPIGLDELQALVE